MREFAKMARALCLEDNTAIINELRNNSTVCGFLISTPIHELEYDVLDQLLQNGMNIKYVISEQPVNTASVFDRKNILLNDIKDMPQKELPETVIMLQTPVSNAYNDYLRKYGMRTIFAVDSVLVRAFQKIFTEHLPELYDIYSMLSGEISRKVFLADIIGDVSYDIGKYVFASEPQYMLQGFLPKAGDIAFDCGCYDGAVARDLVSLGAQVYAFEIDSNNMLKCRMAAEKYGFILENMGIWSAAKEMSFNHDDTASAITDNGEDVVECIDIDTYMLHNNITRLDYLKMDIEGAELEGLKGARSAIARFKPKMAISIYHKASDMWELPAYIKSIRPDYEFEWRHYPVNIADYWMDKSVYKQRLALGLNGDITMACEKVLYCK